MDSLTSLAIIRIMQTARNDKALHVSDIVASLKWMIPDVEHDEASVLEHLTLMTGNGYVLPVPVVVV